MPVEVKGLEHVTAIAAGHGFALAVLEGGKVMAWGENKYGQLGDGKSGSEQAYSDEPVEVKGLPEGAHTVAGGEGFALALLNNGHVMAWGENAFGQLGNGNTTNSGAPVEVKEMTEATAVAAGADHTLALLKNGEVRSWGWDVVGQLGNGTCCSNSSVPVTVTGTTEATAIAAGAYHSLLLLKNGTVMAWGKNASGQLGDGQTAGPEQCAFSVPCSKVPVQVEELTEAIGLGGGEVFSLAVGRL